MLPGHKSENNERPIVKMFNMKAAPSFYKMIDDWRRAQPELLSRSEAVRVLIQKGINSDKSE